MKLVDQYMTIFFNFKTTSIHLHPLQVENCNSNSRLVGGEDDNGKFRLERVNINYTFYMALIPQLIICIFVNFITSVVSLMKYFVTHPTKLEGSHISFRKVIDDMEEESKKASLPVGLTKIPSLTLSLISM